MAHVIPLSEMPTETLVFFQTPLAGEAERRVEPNRGTSLREEQWQRDYTASRKHRGIAVD